MARFRDVDMQPKLIPVDFAAQILPGTFEHALSVLVDDDLELSAFEGSFKNDDKGAPAYHPGVLVTSCDKTGNSGMRRSEVA
jgi:hypothetical protein